MGGSYAPLLKSIWHDEDFARLSRLAQHTYTLLISQPDVTWCGVVSYTPRRWATYSADADLATLEEGISELEKGGFVVLDRVTEELLIRSFIKHNRVLSQPKVATAMRRQYGDIHSPAIQSHIYSQLPPEEQEKVGPPRASSQVETPGDDHAKGYREGYAKPQAMTSGVNPPTPTPTPSSSPKPEDEELEKLARAKLATRIAALGPVGDERAWLERVKIDIAKNPPEPIEVTPHPANRTSLGCDDCDNGFTFDDDGLAHPCANCHRTSVAS